VTGTRSSSFVEELAGGLFDTTPASFLGAVLLCVVELAACCVMFQPARLVRLDAGYLMESRHDNFPLLSKRLLALRLGLGPPGLHVAYLGGSQSTRTLAHVDPEVLGREVGRAAGRPVTFDLLSADTEHFEESLAITDQFPPSFRGVLVQFVSESKNDYAHADRRAQDRNRIAVIDAPSITSFYAEEGYAQPHTGIFFLDNLGFFAARRVAAFRPMPAEVWPDAPPPPDYAIQRYRASVRRLRDKARHVDDDEALRERIHGRAPFFTSSKRVIAQLVANMRARGVVMVFVEPPENPLRAELYAERIARYRRDMAAFARENDAEFWNLNDELDLVPEDFYDEFHVESEEVQEKVEGLVVDHLGALIRSRFGTDGQTPATSDAGRR
jgi:hypothetical protein